MNRRIVPMLRSAIAMLALCALSSLLPTPLAAQKIDNCACDLITIFSDKATPCTVQFTFESPDGTLQTVTLPPGGSSAVPCIPGTIVSIVDCLGRRQPITPGTCRFNVNGSSRQASCCIDACLEERAPGCWTAFVRPTIVMAPGCPCVQ